MRKVLFLVRRGDVAERGGQVPLALRVDRAPGHERQPR